MAHLREDASIALSTVPRRSAPEGAQSIRRAANILRAVGSFGRSGAPVRKIALLSGLHKATAHRILCVLASEGLLEQDATTRNYRLGAEVSALTASMGPQFDIRLIGNAALDNLSEATHDTIQLGVRTYYDGLCLDVREGRPPLKLLRLKANECWPLGIGAFSIALLAFLADQEIDLIIKRNAKYLLGQRDITPADVLRHVQDTRERGYAENRNLGKLGMGAVAVPVFDAARRPFASLCITTTIDRLNESRRDRLVDLLWQESRKMTSLWSEQSEFVRRDLWRQGLAPWSLKSQ